MKLLAPDAVFSREAIRASGGRAAGMVVSVARVPPPLLPPSGRAFVAALRERIGAGRVDPHVAYAAAAADVLVSAIAASNGSLASVAANLFRPANGRRPIGDIELDRRGDPISPAFALYRVEQTLQPFGTVTPPARLVRAAAGG